MRQHFVPQSYLQAWCDPHTPADQEPFTWVFTKSGTYKECRSPKNIFWETDFYTLFKVDGQRDLSLEKGLSQLEGQFALLRRDKLEQRQPLSDDDQIVLCAFAAAMFARTKASKDRMRPLWQELQKKITEMTNWVGASAPEQLEASYKSAPIDNSSLYPVNIEEIKQIVEEPVKSLLTTYIQEATPLFLQMDMAIIETSAKPGFITSDDPCVWFDPESYKRPFPHKGPALIYPSIEIYLPLSPSQCLFLNRRGEKGYIRLCEYGALADVQVVSEANRRTRKSANQFIITNGNKLLESWFVQL